MNAWQRKFIKVDIDKPTQEQELRVKRKKDRHSELYFIDYCFKSKDLWTVRQGIKALFKEEDKESAISRLDELLLDSLRDKNANLERIKLCVKYGATLPVQEVYSVKYVDAPVECLKFLFDECQMGNDDIYQNLLSKASRCGAIDTVKYLLTENKCDAKALNKISRGDLMSVSGAFPDMLPLLQERGFDFETRKIDLLLCGLSNRNEALTEYVLDRFSAVEKYNLHMDTFKSIKNTAGGLLNLLDKYEIRPKGYNFFKALGAAEKNDIETLENLVKQQDVSINYDDSAILIKALATESRSFVEKVYELGGRFENSTQFPKRSMLQAVDMSSYPFLENVSQFDNADEIFNEILEWDCCSSGYMKRILELWEDCPADKLVSLIESAIDKQSIRMVETLVDAGLDLKKIGNQTIYEVVRKANSPTFIDQLKDMGLEIEKNLDVLINRCGEEQKGKGIFGYLKGLKIMQEVKTYPRWEKQDDNTVAELSFVRKTSKEGFLRLRRAFNFRAGLVDQSYETCANKDVVDFKPAESLEMSRVSPDMINQARKELEDLGGSAKGFSREEKAPKPLRPRHN